MPTSTRRILRKVASLLSRSPSKSQEAGGVDKQHDELEETLVGSLPGLLPQLGAKVAPKDATEFFFARVPPTVTYDELVAVFGRFGEVEVNLFRPFAEAKTSKGCGIVRFASSAAAAAAKAELHDKHKWSPEYAPMVLERVVEKKKRGNISGNGTAELIFTPKFLTNKKGINAADSTTQQHHTPNRRGGSSCSLAQPDLRQLSCSIGSAVGMARFHSCSSSNSGSTPSCVRDVTRVPDRACCQRAAANSTFQLPAAAVESLISSDRNLLQSAVLLQLPAGADTTAARAEDLLSSGHVGHRSSTHDMGPQQQFLPSERSSFEQQQQQAFQHLQRQTALAAERAATAWLQQYQLMGQQLPALDFNEAFAAAGAAAPAVWPLGPTALLPCGLTPYGVAAQPALSAAGAFAAQPTSLTILGGGMQQQQRQLLSCMNGDLANGLALIPSGFHLPCDSLSGQHVHSSGLQGFTVVPTVTAAAVDDSSNFPLPTLSSAFNARECFSNFSNLLDGHPSMQCAQARARMSGSLPMMQGVDSLAEAAAAAADCSASMLASGSSFCFKPQQQQQQQLQTQQSGSNLQLTTGGLYVAQGGTWDSTNAVIQQQQQQHVLLESLSAADDEGYFDLAYKSGSSSDSLKLADNPADNSMNASSCPPKVTSCSSNNSSGGVNGGAGVNAGCGQMSSQAAAELAARQQQHRLLAMQEQHQLMLAGQQSGAPPSGPGSALGRQGGGGTLNAPACWLPGAPWLLPQQQQPGAAGVALLAGGMQELPNSGSSMPGPFAAQRQGSGASAAAPQDQVMSVDLPATAQAAPVVALHLPSIKSLTGADVQIVPAAAAGQLALRLSGRLSEVQLACSIIDVLLQSQQQCQMS